MRRLILGLLLVVAVGAAGAEEDAPIRTSIPALGDTSSLIDYTLLGPRGSAVGIGPIVAGQTIATPEIASDGDFDAPPEAKNRLTENLSYGAKISLEFNYERDFDLDRDVKDKLATVDPQLEFALHYQPDEDFLAFVNVEFSRELGLQDQGEKENRDTQLVVDEAYVLFSDVVEIDDAFEDVEIQIGRQKIDDSREWLLDQELDAVRLLFETFDVDVELSVSRENLFRRNIFSDDDEGRINNYIAYAEYKVLEDYKGIDEIEVATYAIFRDNREDDKEDPLFLGIQSTGEFGGLEVWADFAHARGKDGSDKIRAYGLDLGAVYTFDRPLMPHVALGYAFGSGDGNTDDNTDKNFRQTGLEGNSDKLGGVVSLKYYGELFDPELSNMSILTAGVGIRPTKRSSIDLVYHHYWLDEHTDELRDAGVEEDLDRGMTEKDIGGEIDLVMGYRDIPGFEVELNLGYFMPGPAFADGADDAFLVNFEVSYEF